MDLFRTVLRDSGQVGGHRGPHLQSMDEDQSAASSTPLMDLFRCVLHYEIAVMYRKGRLFQEAQIEVTGVNLQETHYRQVGNFLSQRYQTSVVSAFSEDRLTIRFKQASRRALVRLGAVSRRWQIVLSGIYRGKVVFEGCLAVHLGCRQLPKYDQAVVEDCEHLFRSLTDVDNLSLLEHSTLRDPLG